MGKRRIGSCYLCGHRTFRRRKGKVRDIKNIKIIECIHCGLVFLDNFDHIGENFYEDSGMHEHTISIEDWLRETASDDERRIHFLRKMIENKTLLDFGCGNGGFLMRARKFASLAEGIEVERDLEAHFRVNKLRVYKSAAEVEKKYDVITAFHVIEHLKDPAATLSSLAELLKDDGLIIVEVPNADDALLSLYQCKAFSEFTYWSCHLYLFKNDTIKLLASKAGLRTTFIKQIQRYPLSNHLYWLAFGRPGGHSKWAFLDSARLNEEYEKALASVGICDTIIAGLSK